MSTDIKNHIEKMSKTLHLPWVLFSFFFFTSLTYKMRKTTDDMMKPTDIEIKCSRACWSSIWYPQGWEFWICKVWRLLHIEKLSVFLGLNWAFLASDAFWCMRQQLKLRTEQHNLQNNQIILKMLQALHCTQSSPKGVIPELIKRALMIDRAGHWGMTLPCPN